MEAKKKISFVRYPLAFIIFRFLLSYVQLPWVQERSAIDSGLSLRIFTDLLFGSGFPLGNERLGGRTCSLHTGLVVHVTQLFG